MDTEQFVDRFYALLEDTNREDISLSTKFKELDEWDSMLSLMLIAMADEKYKKQIDGNDIRKSTTIEDLFYVIKEK